MNFLSLRPSCASALKSCEILYGSIKKNHISIDITCCYAMHNQSILSSGLGEYIEISYKHTFFGIKYKKKFVFLIHSKTVSDFCNEQYEKGFISYVMNYGGWPRKISWYPYTFNRVWTSYVALYFPRWIFAQDIVVNRQTDVEIDCVGFNSCVTWIINIFLVDFEGFFQYQQSTNLELLTVHVNSKSINCYKICSDVYDYAVHWFYPWHKNSFVGYGIKFRGYSKFPRKMVYGSVSLTRSWDFIVYIVLIDFVIRYTK